ARGWFAAARKPVARTTPSRAPGASATEKEERALTGSAQEQAAVRGTALRQMTDLLEPPQRAARPELRRQTHAFRRPIFRSQCSRPPGCESVPHSQNGTAT